MRWTMQPYVLSLRIRARGAYGQRLLQEHLHKESLLVRGLLRERERMGVVVRRRLPV